MIALPLGLSESQIATLLGRGVELPNMSSGVTAQSGMEVLQQVTHVIHQPLGVSNVFAAGFAIGYCFGRGIPILQIGGGDDPEPLFNLNYWPDWNAFLRDLDRVLQNDPWWERPVPGPRD